ncbi:hypothetical protein H4R20_000993 [Coemansia guatemalensis]|uniref:Dolichyldiphosphatase n=1 Tax=Coemansia guatemalensis TaxID=2761395 RepID=A0A9W8HY56_9FUNG|nr:hypothetical protein H4R20_000993 [Coemansia guatemalensis]
MSIKQQEQLKPFGLTHFQYREGDSIGMVLALASLFPIFLIVAETSIILGRREAAGILFLLGQLLNEAFNLVLKHAIRDERPNIHLGDGYGMPSSHSQFMGYFVLYMVVYLERHIATNVVHKRVTQLGAFILGISVAFSRVYLGYHTVWQVLAGAVVGVGFGVIWYLFVEQVLRPSGLLDLILATSFCRWLLIRDSRHVLDVALAEYNLSMATKSKQL